jgi:hypothetical protein
VATSGVVIHYTEGGCQSPNTKEVHSFKWGFVFDLHDAFQECNIIYSILILAYNGTCL